MKNSVKILSTLTFIWLMASAFISRPTDFGGAWVLFAGKYGGEINKQEIAAQTCITVGGCSKDWRVTTFTLVVTQSGKTNSYTTDSATLTAEMSTQLNSLKNGDAFEFQQTKAYIKEGKYLVDVRDAKFTVIDKRAR